MESEWLSYIPGAAYITDTEGNILSYNTSAELLWGRKPVRGTDKWTAAHKLYSVEGEPLLPEKLPMATAAREGQVERGQVLLLERPDGSRRLIIQQPKRMLDSEGRITGVINVVTDVTAIATSLEQKIRSSLAQVEVKQGELIQSEERYHKMIAEVEDYAILLLSKQGVIQNWNIGAEKIKGYKEAEIVGRHFRVFYTAEDQEARLPERLIAEAAEKGKAIHEGWRRRKDGTLFWGSIVITALHDGLGSVIGFSKVTRDLTARRVAEEKLKRYSRDLEFQNKELQQFAYAAAHDIKEPLRKLRFYNSSLLESLQGRLSEKETLYFQRATDAAIRMQLLIDDLLAYSKASSEGGAFTAIDLSEILEEAEATYQDRIEETGAVIGTGPLPVVWGVAFQLRQLFENLLGNALKYHDPARTPVIRIESEENADLPQGALPEEMRSGKYFKISIEDNGIGFEKNQAERIFDIFQRLDTQGKFPGTGIGLAISKRVIQNHNGYIMAEGQPGQGAIFTFYLPMDNGSSMISAERQ